jgi:hypothetical protein
VKELLQVRLFKPYVHYFDDMLLGLDEGSSNVVPKSKVKITKKCGHGENNAKAGKTWRSSKKNSLPQSFESAKSDTVQQRK